MLTKLKILLEKHGTLSAELIDNAEAMPASSSYHGRFGSLIKADSQRPILSASAS